jgi:hypothetical protein
MATRRLHGGQVPPVCRDRSIDSNFADAGVARLEGLTNLTYLNFCNTHATDAGLVHLSSLANLSELLLCNTAVTDPGLAHLKGLSKLSQLYLRGG